MENRPSITVRAAGPADAREIARLNSLFNGVELPPEHYTGRMADPVRVDIPVLAELGGRIVGIANLRILQPVFYLEPYAELTELYVEEAYRRQGAARALLAFSEKLAREAGALEIFVLTGFQNQAAQVLYRSMGYDRQYLALAKRLK
jgi:GNAT superfamily N-acetyltransferase